MSIRGKIKRLGLLVEYIQRSNYPSKQKLLSFLEEEGFNTSTRTLDRDIEAIRDEFWLEITYSRTYNGYYLRESELNHASTLLKIFTLISTSDLLVENLKQGKKALEHIQFDSSDQLKGIHLLPEILKAISNSKEIGFTYKNYYSTTEKQIILKPLLLKEYNKRWYVIGYNDAAKDYRTYGIDRMTEFKILDKSFQPSGYQQPKDFFIHTVGLTYTQEVPQLVRIWFTKEQARYIKSLPLHQSQEVESESPDGFTMSYFVVPNFEFKQKILMQMAYAAVLEPKSLAKDIRKIASKIAKNYKSK